MFKKSLLSLIIIAFVISIISPTVFAAEEGALIDVTGISDYPTGPSVGAGGIILVEAKSGVVLFGKNAETKYYPASITKILTALVVLENCSLDETVTFSYRATHELESGSSSIARTEGEQMSVRECLYGMLVASANECAQALAEHVSGSFEAFADKMNETAVSLGCKNSHFTNPSGLNDSEHYTTCYDMALIMRAAIKNPDFVEIDSSVTHTIPKTNKHDAELPISMSHELLKGSQKYKWAVCGKTGYTQAAGFTLATYASKSNMDLICICMHCQSSSDRATSSISAFDFGFNNFTSYDLGEVSDTLGISKEETSGFLNPNLLTLKAATGSAVVLPNGYDISTLETSVNWNKNSLNADCIGRVIYKIGGKAVGQADLIVDTTAHDNFAFLKNDTSGEASGEEESEGSSVATVLIILGIIFLLLIIGGLFLYQFINGKSKRRKKRGVKVDKRLGI